MNNILEQDLKTYITRDYSVFKYLSGNRDINLHNVNNIVKNVLDNGLLPTIVIVNENMEVIDGQHRIEAFKQLNLPVEFQIRKGLGLKDCIAYNVSSKKWETVDYIKSYAERGIDDYITLKKCIDEYPSFSPSTLAAILLGRDAQGGGVSQIIRCGKFKIVGNINQKINKLNFLDSVQEYIVVRGRKEVVIQVLANVIDLEVIDQDRMVEQLQKVANKNVSVACVDDALEYLYDVYNHRKKNKVRFKDAYYDRFA